MESHRAEESTPPGFSSCAGFPACRPRVPAGAMSVVLFFPWWCVGAFTVRNALYNALYKETQSARFFSLFSVQSGIALYMAPNNGYTRILRKSLTTWAQKPKCAFCFFGTYRKQRKETRSGVFRCFPVSVAATAVLYVPLFLLRARAGSDLRTSGADYRCKAIA